VNIYIYGDDAFKNEVENIINHSNLRLYLDESCQIEEVDSAEAIKLLIEQEPEHIYLIDNDKILKPNSLNSKIKFLKPKGAIEQSFLEEHGVLDSKFDSIEELIKDLKEQYKDNAPPELLAEQDEFSQIDEDPVEEYSFNNSIDYGEDDIDTQIEGLTSDNDDFEQEIEENYLENDIIEENDQGNQLQEYFMTENIDSIDNISEEAMLNALNNMDDIDISSIQSASPTPTASNVEEISLSGSNANANEIASLISQLLTNKTLEITIKVKS